MGIDGIPQSMLACQVVECKVDVMDTPGTGVELTALSWKTLPDPTSPHPEQTRRV